MFLDRGADIDIQDYFNEAPLHYAVRYERSAIVNLLLDRGADIDAKDEHGTSSLHKASVQGNIAIVRLLLDRNASSDVKNESDHTPLHFAVWQGHISIVRLLLNHHSEIEAKDSNGRTPLHLASEFGHVEIARLLIRRGALVSEPAIEAAANSNIKTVLKDLAERPRILFVEPETLKIQKVSGVDYPLKEQGAIGIEMLGENGQWSAIDSDEIRWDLPHAIFRAVIRN